jgi:HEAT repeat protein
MTGHRHAPAQGKVFFSEEKKQKTFEIAGHPFSGAHQKVKSFLVLFFKKEHASLMALCHIAHTQPRAPLNVPALREVAAEVTSVFTIPPDLLTEPSLGVLPDHRIIFRRSDAPDGSPYVKGTAADLTELVYFKAWESLRLIPASVKIPFLLSVSDSRASVIGRMQALGALLQAGDTSRLQAALPYLLHPDERTSGLVALGLDYLSSRRRDDLVPVSIELLRSRDSSIREAAIMIFKASRLPAVRAALARALRDPNEQVRASAVFGVCNRSGGACRGQRESTLAMPDHIPALLALLKTETAFDP